MTTSHEVSDDEALPSKAIRVETGGLTVEKALTQHDEDVYKVIFTIASERDESVMIRLQDALPDEIEPGSVGFHPRYDPQRWRLTDSGIVVFEADIEPGDHRETLYGVRVPSSTDPQWLLKAPTVEVRPVESPPSSSGGDRSDGDMEDEDSKGQIADTLDATGDSADFHRGPTESPPTSPVDGDLPNASEGNSSVVEAFVDELQRRGLKESELSVLREHLAVDAANSVSVRLAHVQERVDDLVAYHDALEAFIDEHGEADELISRFETEIADLSETVDALGSRLAAVEDRVNEVAARSDDLAAQHDIAESLQDSVDELRVELDAIHDRHEADIAKLGERDDSLKAALETTHQAIEADIKNLETSIQEWESWRAQLTSAVQFETTEK